MTSATAERRQARLRAHLDPMEPVGARTGSGVLVGVTPGEVWRRVAPPPVRVPGDITGLGALTHLLWWEPSVAAVLVTHADTSVGPHPADVRRVLDLAGSEALLLVEVTGAGRWDELGTEACAADLVVAGLPRRHPAERSVSVLAWSARLAGAVAGLGEVAPLSYGVVARLHAGRANGG